jgi:hypothetical protein
MQLFRLIHTIPNNHTTLDRHGQGLPFGRHIRRAEQVLNDHGGDCAVIRSSTAAAAGDRWTGRTAAASHVDEETFDDDLGDRFDGRRWNSRRCDGCLVVIAKQSLQRIHWNTNVLVTTPLTRGAERRTVVVGGGGGGGGGDAWKGSGGDPLDPRSKKSHSRPNSVGNYVSLIYRRTFRRGARHASLIEVWEKRRQTKSMEVSPATTPTKSTWTMSNEDRPKVKLVNRRAS